METDELEDLVGAEPESKNWKGVALALLTICIICALVAAAVLILEPEETRLGTVTLTLDHVFDPKLKPRDIRFQWINLGQSVVQEGSTVDEFLVQDSKGNIIKHTTNNYSQSVFLHITKLQQYSAKDFIVSEDGEFLVIQTDAEPLHTYSSIAYYRVLQRNYVGWYSDINLKQFYEHKLRFCEVISGKILLLGTEHEIFYLDLSSPQSLKLGVQYVMRIGDPAIYLGAADWFYETQILKSSHAHWSSPGGQLIAFLEINTNLLHTVPFINYHTPDDDITELPYPMMDTPIPSARVHIFSFADKVDRTIKSPFSSETEHYVLCVTWLTDRYLVVDFVDRTSRTLITAIYDVANPSQMEISPIGLYKSESLETGWLETCSRPVAWDKELVDGWFVGIALQLQGSSEEGRWEHIRLMNIKGESKLSAPIYLTSGLFTVTKLLGAVPVTDSREIEVYYLSTEKSPLEKHVYRLRFSPDEFGMNEDWPQVERECLTCDLEIPGQLQAKSLAGRCGYFEAKLSPKRTHLYLNCLGPGYPMQLLMELKNLRLTVLEDNQELQNLSYDLKLTKKMLSNITMKNGEVINTLLMTPPILDTSHRYPVLIYLDQDAPGQQSVDARWQFDWLDVIASTYHLLVIKINHHGSSVRGELFHTSIKDQVGSLEVADIMEVMRFYTRKGTINPNNVAFYGEGYDALIVGKLLGTTKTRAKCAILHRPWANVRYQNSLKSQRLLSTSPVPDSKPSMGTQLASNMRSGIFLIHNTQEEDVLFHNTAAIIDQLTEAGASFHTQIYTDKQHTTSDPIVKKHLVNLMTNHLIHCLRLNPPNVK